MRSTILRLPEGIALTETLQTTLESLLGAEFTVEFFSRNPNPILSYQQRIASLKTAFEFLCNAIPPQKDPAAIRTYLVWAHAYCQLPLNKALPQYQEKLAIYTKLLLNAVCYLWSWTPDVAINLLDKAEQYLLLQEERPPFATLTVASPDSSTYCLIVDTPIAPFLPETIAELKQIKATPDISSPYSASLAVSRESSDLDLFSVFSEFELSASPADQVPIPWFNCLPREERQLLCHALQNLDLDNPNTVFFISSRLRTIPGLANAAQHQLHLIHSDGVLIKSFDPRLRSAHLGSRDMMHYPEAIHTVHTQRNAALLQHHANQDPLSPRPLLIQTLISPIHIPAIPNTWLPIPDPFLDQQRLAAVDYLKTKHQPIFSSNHPFNIARAVLWTPTNSEECAQILEAAQRHLDSIKMQHTHPEELATELEELINGYKNCLNSGLGTAWPADYNGRELFLSSQEDILMTYLNGVSYGSCVSGKDRKAIQLLHTCAMLIFHNDYNRWPSYTDEGEERIKFVQIFTQIYQTRHYQLFSGQNAPGADGIKNPDSYLPQDINTTIGKIPLQEDDRLASNNELEKIVTIGKISPQYPENILAAMRLNEDHRCELLTQLTIIVMQEAYWKSQTKPSVFSLSFYTQTPSTMPEGISKIANLLTGLTTDPLSALSTTQQLADIYQVVQQRPRGHIGRSPMTETLYRTLEMLATNPDPNGFFAKAHEALLQIKQTAIEKSKPSQHTAAVVA